MKNKVSILVYGVCERKTHLWPLPPNGFNFGLHPENNIKGRVTCRDAAAFIFRYSREVGCGSVGKRDSGATFPLRTQNHQWTSGSMQHLTRHNCSHLTFLGKGLPLCEHSSSDALGLCWDKNRSKQPEVAAGLSHGLVQQLLPSWPPQAPPSSPPPLERAAWPGRTSE